MSKGIFAALEELDEGSAIYGDTPYGEGIEGAEEDAHEENLRREASDEINLTANHLGDLNEVVDQSQGAVDDLIAVGDSLSTESEVFNIDEVSIKPTIIAVEALYRKLGVKEITLPSLESFSDSDSSKLAVEHLKISIEEKAEEAKSGIAKMIEKIWNFIKGLFEKVIEAFKNMFLPSIKGLIKKLEALKATEPKEKTIKDSRLIKAFGKPNEENINSNKVKECIENMTKIMAITSTLIQYYKETKINDKRVSTYEGIIFDSSLVLTIDDKTNQISVEIKSGWDGKDAGDKTIELANKTESIEILKKIKNVDETIKSEFDVTSRVHDHQVKEAKKQNFSPDDIKELELNSKITHKLIPRALSLLAKAVNASIDYCNKSYKEIKANEGGKEEKEEGNKE